MLAPITETTECEELLYCEPRCRCYLQEILADEQPVSSPPFHLEAFTVNHLLVARYGVCLPEVKVETGERCPLLPRPSPNRLGPSGVSLLCGSG